MADPTLDLAIAGGGATGLAAAIQAASDGLRVVLLERAAFGGRLRERARLETVPGLPVGLSGAAFTEQAVALATRLGADLRCGAEEVGLEVGAAARRLRLAHGAAVAARTVIVATGTEYPVLPAPGIRDFTGRGVYFGAPARPPEILRGREVFVTGEPAAAAEAAAALAGHCRRVILLLPGARPPSRPVAAGPGRVPRWTRCEVVEAVGVERLEALVLRDVPSGRTFVRNAAALFVLGLDRPRTGWLAGALALDGRGYVLTGPAPSAGGIAPRSPLECSVPGVFAAGGARGTRDCCAEVAGMEGIGVARQALEHLRRPAAVASAAAE
jgi:thioredoxin reductase (NADPH)